MYRRKKGTPTKVYFAIILVVVLIVASAAIIYATSTNTPKAVVAGVSVGDSFTYQLRGTSILTGENATQPAEFGQYNATQYYKVTITDVQGTFVSLSTEWKFQNGTSLTSQNTIDISNGNQTDENGFWAIYAGGLQQNDKLRPTGADGLIVNSTDTKTYANSSRVRNCFTVENSFFDINDPTQSTWRNDYITAFFDQETGVLDTLTNVQGYNNPQMTLVVVWQLKNSTVWDV
ncbi:MAG: hypothetical protein NWE92_10075 [Candidatus Bathyarchaeota archaeon]|nr:hypothetical protein [Candidatus Bathyarchaeota archaeon]